MATSIQLEETEKLIMLSHTRIKICTSILFVAFTASCSAKTPIELENGEVVDNCTSYNKLRESFTIKESTVNSQISSEYLECSIKKELVDTENSASVLDAIKGNLRVRKLPLSIAQSVNRKDTFNDAGFNVDLKLNSLNYEMNNSNIVISLKGRLTESEYLIWIVDEVLDATYRSYYPAIIKIAKDGMVTASPYYNSDF